MNNIVLIGMMGSGKTTLGRVISAHGDFQLIDTDQEIENRSHMPIPHIFEQYGESYFRELEVSAAERAAAHKRAVIATGGGLVTIARSMEFLRATGFVVYLRCEMSVLLARTQASAHARPLLDALTNEEKLERLRELLAVRDPLYQQYSDFTLDTDTGSMDELARIIMEQYDTNQRTRRLL